MNSDQSIDSLTHLHPQTMPVVHVH